MLVPAKTKKEKTMSINWNKITVTCSTPDVPDFNLEFECQDGWDEPTWDESEGETGDWACEGSGEFDGEGDDGPSDGDLTDIEREDLLCI